MDHRAKHKIKSTYAVEGIEQDAPGKGAGQRSQSRALIESQLADLQKQCNGNREALGELKVQRDEAEKRAAQAAQSAKAAAQAAKSINPPAATGPAPNPGAGGSGFQQQRGGYRGRGRGRGNYHTKSDDICHKCGGQGHWARDCPNQTPPKQPVAPPAPAAAKVVDYKAERGWVGTEFRDEPIRCMLYLGIHKAAIGEKFLVEDLWKRNPHNKEYETLVNGNPVHVLGQTMIVFRLASGDCREIMATQVDISPDVDGLVLGMEWMHENTCMWNVRTGSQRYRRHSLPRRV